MSAGLVLRMIKEVALAGEIGGMPTQDVKGLFVDARASAGLAVIVVHGRVYACASRAIRVVEVPAGLSGLVDGEGTVMMVVIAAVMRR